MSSPGSLRIKPFNQFKLDFKLAQSEKLGAGGYGKVYLVYSIRDRSQLFAAKYQKLVDKGAKQSVRAEVQILAALENPRHVLRLSSYYETDRNSVVVTEYLQGGELFARIGSQDYKLTEAKVRMFIRQMVEALQFIHSRGIIHLDLKPQNIMLVKPDSEELKLIDFGLARQLGKNGMVNAGFCGTVGFMAPEVANVLYASKASDMFSLGVIVYMLVSGGLEPFWDGNEYRTIRRTIRGRWNFNHSAFKDVGDQAKAFIQGLLKLTPSDRLTGAQCLNHPWLNEIKILKGFVLNTSFMRKYLARRRWHKAIAAVRAVNRIRNMVKDDGDGDSSSTEFYSTITDQWV